MLATTASFAVAGVAPARPHLSQDEEYRNNIFANDFGADNVHDLLHIGHLLHFAWRVCLVLWDWTSGLWQRLLLLIIFACVLSRRKMLHIRKQVLR